MKTPIAILISTLMLIGYLAYQHNEDRKYQEFERLMWFYVTGLKYQDGPGLKIKSFSYSLDKTKAMQFGKLNAETYSKQINSPSFGAKSHVEPGKTAVKAGR